MAPYNPSKLIEFPLLRFQLVPQYYVQQYTGTVNNALEAYTLSNLISLARFEDKIRILLSKYSAHKLIILKALTDKNIIIREKWQIKRVFAATFF